MGRDADDSIDRQQNGPASCFRLAIGLDIILYAMRARYHYAKPESLFYQRNGHSGQLKILLLFTLEQMRASAKGVSWIRYSVHQLSTGAIFRCKTTYALMITIGIWRL